MICKFYVEKVFFFKFQVLNTQFQKKKTSFDLHQGHLVAFPIIFKKLTIYIVFIISLNF